MSSIRGETIVTLVIVVIILMLHFLGFGLYIILTDSMSPTVSPGSLVFTVPPYLKHPSVGDIVVYHVKIGGCKYVIMHRIVSQFERDGTVYFVTKGDNRRFPDQWFVPEGNIDGVFLFHIPYVGYLLYAPYRYYPFYAGAVITLSASYIAHIIISDIERSKMQKRVKAVKRERETLRVLRKKLKCGRGRK